ncbi:MAG: transglutaminase family protein [Hyphomicrobium sp.]
MIFDISHKTHYRYSLPVVQSQHLIHMSPRQLTRQTIRHHSLIVEPAPAHRFDGIDAFNNPVQILDIEVPHKELILHARSTIETHGNALPESVANGGRLQGIGREPSRDMALPLEVVQFRCPSRQTTATPDIRRYARQAFVAGRPVLAAALELNQRIFDDFTFDATATDVSTPIQDVFRHKRGVCQDFAHFALTCLRAVHVPARYVSGYILTHPPAGQARLQGADASHAWISVWTPETDWVDLDPTNGTVVSDQHITIAVGRDYDDVSPISGVLLGGGEHSVSVSVDVLPIG